MNNNVEKNVKHEECTGCGACFNICPQKAISMKENEEGFLYPNIEMEKCIDCGLCLQKCPVQYPQYRNEANPECRAVYAKDSIRIHAASGGVFSAFAELLLDRGGIVCGASFTEEFKVIHTLVRDKKELNKIKSSKYVQSNTNNVYVRIEKELKEGKEVLFCGCPCQVAGLYAYLGKKQYDRLYTMDLVCHGVPSSKSLIKYMHDKIGDKKITNIEFRNKELFGWSSSIAITLEDGTVYKNSHNNDSFYRAFLNGLSVRLSCNNCKFSRLPRQGDLTIGDFWGISKFDKSLNDNKGTSLILINNRKGEKIVKECNGLWDKNVKFPIEAGIDSNRAVISHFRGHPSRRRFFENLENGSIDKLVNDCLTHHYDVGIVGLWYGLNYGSILTYYALNKVITDMGYQCLMVNKPIELWDKRFEDRNSVANRFIYKHCYVSNIRKSWKDWNELSDHCDCFVVGSDVVWNYSICGKEAGHFFFLDFVKNSKKKIAYASSLGSGISDNYEYETLAKYYLHRFDYISVREHSAKNLVKQHYDVEAEQVLDPVFLCDKNHYLRVISDSDVSEDIPFLTSYFLGPSVQKRNLILNICDTLHLDYRNLNNPNVNTEVLEKRLGLKIMQDVTVENWLYYIKNCNFYVGDSFHGLCFSLIFEKPFIVMIDKNLPSRTRFDTLLSLTGLEDRMVYLDVKKEQIDEILKKDIDYVEVWRKLDEHKKRSLEWLQKALKSEKQNIGDATEFIIEHLQNRINFLEDKIENISKK